MAEDQQHAPSASRRKRLKEREAVEGKTFTKVLDSFPIEKYYGMSDRLLMAFGQAVDERRLDDAYVFGLRFATFSLECLPKHKQYNHPNYKRLKLKNARQVEEVLQKMESVATRMDAEELRLARQRKEAQRREEEARRKKEEAIRQQEEQRLHEEAAKRQRHQQVLQQQREELKAQQAADLIRKREQEQQEVQKRAMDKLKLLNQRNLSVTAQPRQERDAANTTELISVNTGQAPHSKEAVAQQKAAEAEAARRKEEEEKREASQGPSFQATLQSKLKLFQKKTDSPKSKKTTKAKTDAPREPSRLDPKALEQVKQLKLEISKPDKKQVSDYKSDFAKFQAEWNSKKNVNSTKEEEAHAPSFQQSAHSKLKLFQNESTQSNSSRQIKGQDPPGSLQRPSSIKQMSTGRIQSKPSTESHETPAFKETAPKLKIFQQAESNNQQNNNFASVEPPPQSQPSVPAQESSPKTNAPKFPVPSKSKLKLFQLSPKKKSTKQAISTDPEPADEGFELTMTDAGPAIVDDFCYHDDAYRAKLTPAEAKTIQMLETAIQLQERRLRVLESSNERQLLRAEAKQRLKNGDRKGALHCLAKKKRINQTIDVVKAAIFNMETQIIMLESAVENREVNKIMKEASDQMASFGNSIRVSDFTDEKLGDVLASVGQGGMDLEYDEEDLLSELQDGDEKVDLAAGEDDGLLSLPTVPDAEVDTIPDNLPKKEEDAVKRILASLF